MEEKLKRYWVSWYTPDGEVETSFEYGRRENYNADGMEILYALIDAPSKEEVWKGIAKFFPNFTERFIQERHLSWQPSSHPEFKPKHTTIRDLKVKKYDVYAEITATAYVGTVEAKTERQAHKKAMQLDKQVTLCEECKKEISNIEVKDSYTIKSR
ncbi:hypothetical protein [Candidatus Uabimicrobium amorphum]|uniref:Uncharacterized protein n=1 Tax=Uabimicrobium amorphum TaxID=2596890 RepID=A0A5S9IMS5_UABAM|nr:hypothetical protein [Candidatus Uabimicrobium amorphum]BBM84739.1 hypothetical protein UABAM_03100 [Candidatus Uabimicrobium amorphum]